MSEFPIIDMGILKFLYPSLTFKTLKFPFGAFGNTHISVYARRNLNMQILLVIHSPRIQANFR